MAPPRQRVLESRGIFYAVMTALGALAVLGLALGGLWLFHRNGDFYSALRGRLDSGFYWSAALLLVFSSVFYTPFSYGISHYFLRSFEGQARFSDLFFLFRAPRLLTKATVLSMIKKGLVYLERLVVLLVGAVIQVALFFISLVITGENVFAVQGNPFLLAAQFMGHTPWLMGLSVVLWCGMLCLFFYIYLRYILCKYVLLLYPDVSVFQAIRVGKRALLGHLGATLLFYLGYGAFGVLNLLTMGLYARRARKHTGFSVYAARLVRRGWQDYCRRRSLR